MFHNFCLPNARGAIKRFAIGLSALLTLAIGVPVSARTIAGSTGPGQPAFSQTTPSQALLNNVVRLPVIMGNVPTPSSACRFQTADQAPAVAFCDTFDQPMGTGLDRSGDLLGTVWGVGRVIFGGGEHYSSGTNPTQGQLNNFAPVKIQECGSAPMVFADSDVVICNGQLFEAVNDDGGQTVLAMYPKQPFDIAGRTGTVAFDVSANSEGVHAAWPTFVYTDQPIPVPYSHAPGIDTTARNSFGFTIASDCNSADNQYCSHCPNINQTSVDSMFITQNYRLSQLSFAQLGCVARPAVPSQLNHFEVRLSQTTAQVWASDPGGSGLRLIAEADNIHLPLSRGLIWINDVHYNANKFNQQQSHTFGWDNVGFDGPILPRDLTFDAVEPKVVTSGGAMSLGWGTPSDGTAKAVTIMNVSHIAQAQGAALLFNWYAFEATAPAVRLNGGAWHATSWPFDATTWTWRTIAVPIPLSEVRAGVNTVEFKYSDSVFNSTVVANIDLLLIGAGGIPCNTNPSQPCP